VPLLLRRAAPRAQRLRTSSASSARAGARATAPAPPPRSPSTLADGFVTLLFALALLLSAGYTLASFASGGGPSALAARPFALPAASLLIAAKFLTQALVLLVEALCAVLYQVPSAVAVPASLALIYFRARQQRQQRVEAAQAFAAEQPEVLAAVRARAGRVARTGGGVEAEREGLLGGPSTLLVEEDDVTSALNALRVKDAQLRRSEAELESQSTVVAQLSRDTQQRATAAATAKAFAAQQAATAAAAAQAKAEARDAKDAADAMAAARAAAALRDAQADAQKKTQAIATASARQSVDAAEAAARVAAQDARAAAQFRAAAIAKAKAELQAKAASVDAAARAVALASSPAGTTVMQRASAANAAAGLSASGSEFGSLPSMLDTSSARLPPFFKAAPTPAAAAAAAAGTVKMPAVVTAAPAPGEASGTVKVKGRRTLQEMSLVELGALAAQMVASDAIKELQSQGTVAMLKPKSSDATQQKEKAKPTGTLAFKLPGPSPKK